MPLTSGLFDEGQFDDAQFDIVLGPPAPLPSTTVADALAGRNGAVVLGYRFEWHTIADAILADITEAVIDGTIDLDNDRPILRTADFTIDANRLPGAFPDTGAWVAVIAELVSESQAWERQLGLFRLDEPVQEDGGPGIGLQWKVKANDANVLLQEQKVATSYTVPAGTLVQTAVATAALLAPGIRLSLPTILDPTPAPFVWRPDAVLLTIPNDMLEGANYFDLWADTTGVITTRARLDPEDEAIAVLYADDSEPSMITGTPTLSVRTARGANQVRLSVQDPAIAPVAGTATNVDVDDDGSTLNRGTASLEINRDRVTSKPKADTIIRIELRIEAGKAYELSLDTLPDPRRDAHETYRCIIGGVSAAWRVKGWRLPLRPGATMSHTLTLARNVAVTVA